MSTRWLYIMPMMWSLAACQSGGKPNMPVAKAHGSAITTVSGEKQMGGVGQVLDQPIVVKVNDEKGAAVAGALVEFDGPAGVRFTPAFGLTGTDGQLTATAALGGMAGHSLLQGRTRDKYGKTVEVKIDELALGYQQMLGHELSEKYCSRCHDPESTPERVSNHDNLSKAPHAFSDGATYNSITDANLIAITAHGGQALGKSAEMPPFGETISKSEVNALAAYIRAVADPPYRPLGVAYASK